MPKKLLVISVSIGSGHVRAAQALCETAKLHFPGLTTVHLDAMDYVSALFKKTYKDTYLKVIERHPSLWGYMFSKSDRVEDDDSKMKNLRLAIERLSSTELIREIERHQPDGIICTHFLPAELVSRKIRKGDINVPCWIQVTDFDVHGLWFQKRMEGYFVSCEDASWKLKENDIEASRIHVTGIPIMPQFSGTYSKEDCGREFGVSPDMPTILLMAGGEGLGDMQSLARRILDTNAACQVIALSGKNETLFTSLKDLAEGYGGRLAPMGFTTVIERMMAASDIAVTKPGGLTSSECLALGLPMIIVSPIPGQEERNADYLLENGAALKAMDAVSLENKIKRLIDHPEKRNAMKEQARRISRPDAAKNVLEIIKKSLA